jgi:hypothetical protein
MFSRGDRLKIGLGLGSRSLQKILMHEAAGKQSRVPATQKINMHVIENLANLGYEINNKQQEVYSCTT